MVSPRKTSSDSRRGEGRTAVDSTVAGAGATSINRGAGRAISTQTVSPRDTLLPTPMLPYSRSQGGERMKLSVEFASVSYPEGQAAVAEPAPATERIGYDHIDIFDHVVMGWPIEGRARGPYNAAIPILEALTALAYIAAVTSRVTLGTEVLVLPQRQAALGG